MNAEGDMELKIAATGFKARKRERSESLIFQQTDLVLVTASGAWAGPMAKQCSFG